VCVAKVSGTEAYLESIEEGSVSGVDWRWISYPVN